jgi:eukaryotic-like serine/threonine-protein kinase
MTERTIGPYRVVYTLGEGGMGVVYRAVHRASGDHVALKTVKAADPAMGGALRREILALTRLDHPNIVRVVDHGEDGGRPYYAMEFVEGDSLREQLNARLAEMGPVDGVRPAPVFSNDDVIHHGARMADALAYAHGEGVVHRDLKPGNVVLRDNGTLALIDFGLAMSRVESEGREQTPEGGTSGASLGYASPEQLTGGWVDGRSDLYSLGCLLYELVCGVRVFRGRGLRLVVAHATTPPPPFDQHVLGVAPELAALVLRLLEKPSQARPGYADEVATAFRALGAPAPPDLPPPRILLHRPRYVGQRHAMTALQERLAALPEGGSVIGLRGSSGSGKTRFMMEVGETSSNTQVFMGTCPNTGALPLSCLVEPLASLGSECSSQQLSLEWFGDYGRLLAMYVPELTDTPGFDQWPEPLPMSGLAARDRLFAAITQTFLRKAAHVPVLLFLDDVQWADALTMDFVEWCAHTKPFRGGAVLMVVAWRGEEEPQPITKIAGKALPIVEVQPLDQGQVAAMAADMLAVPSAPPNLARILAETAGGNPFFVGSYLRMAVAEEALERQNGTWCVHGEPGLVGLETRLSVPPTIREMVGRRLGALSAPCQHLIRIAAVLGKVPNQLVLRTVAGGDDATFSAALLEARARGVFAEGVYGQLGFAHDKLRESVLERLPAVLTTSIHGAAVLAYEAHPALAVSRAPDVARHAVAAGDSAKAIQYFDLAAEASYNHLDHADAAHYWRCANDVADPSRQDRRAQLLREAGLSDACHQLGDIEGLIRHGEAALALANHPMPTTAPGYVWHMSREMSLRFLYEVGLIGPSETVDVVSNQRLVRVQNRLSETYATVERGVDGLLSALREVNLASRTPASGELARAFASASIFAAVMPIPRISKRWRKRAQELCDQAEDAPSIAHALVRIDAGSICNLNWDSADENIDRALRIATDLGAARIIGEACAVGSLMNMRRGRFDKAMSFARHAFGLETGLREPQSQAWCATISAGNELARGKPEAALVELGRVDHWVASGDASSADVSWCMTHRAFSLWQLGKNEEALFLVDEVMPLFEKDPRLAYFLTSAILKLGEMSLLAHDNARLERALSALKRIPTTDGLTISKVLRACKTGRALDKAREQALASGLIPLAGVASFWMVRHGQAERAEVEAELVEADLGFYVNQFRSI